jgi:hypothetical protein
VALSLAVHIPLVCFGIALAAMVCSQSLDGFIAGPDDRKGQELGRDGGRLFNWLDDRMSDGPNGHGPGAGGAGCDASAIPSRSDIR